MKELRRSPAHAIGQLFFYAVTPEAEPRDITPVLIDVSAPEMIAAWTAAMRAHASQTSARNMWNCNSPGRGCAGCAPGSNMPSRFFPTIRWFLIRWRKLAGAPAILIWLPARPLKIGITCYPSVGGSGILASALGEELARRGHEVHFISYERPFRLPENAPRLIFHPVVINDYGLFKYPDYTLPLSVKMAEVSRDIGLDVLHVHYAVPHATAAMLARSMLPPGAATARRHDLARHRHHVAGLRSGLRPGHPPRPDPLGRRDGRFPYSEAGNAARARFYGPMEVIHNFFTPRPPAVRARKCAANWACRDEALILHSSNLRPLKRIDLLLETAARIHPRDSFKLLILAGGSFAPFAADVRRLGLKTDHRARKCRGHRRLSAGRRLGAVHLRDRKAFA